MTDTQRVVLRRLSGSSLWPAATLRRDGRNWWMTRTGNPYGWPVQAKTVDALVRKGWAELVDGGDGVVVTVAGKKALGLWV